jgi:DNA replication initiation complex subunit (GINS family)
MGEEIIISYETLFEILRNEKNREDLQKLDDNFLDDISSYVNEKRNSVNEQLNLYSDDERMKANKQLVNIRSMLKELYDKRERKIILMALNKSRTNTIMNLSVMLPSEKELFDNLVELFTSNRDKFMLKAFEVKERKIKKEVIEDEDDEDDEEKSEDVETKLVRFINSVPKFMGKELEVYGPFEEEDVASLPLEIADLLIKKGRAEELSED